MLFDHAFELVKVKPGITCLSVSMSTLMKGIGEWIGQTVVFCILFDLRTCIILAEA